jgi:hypothetical protein
MRTLGLRGSAGIQTCQATKGLARAAFHRSTEYGLVVWIHGSAQFVLTGAAGSRSRGLETRTSGVFAIRNVDVGEVKRVAAVAGERKQVVATPHSLSLAVIKQATQPSR